MNWWDTLSPEVYSICMFAGVVGVLPLLFLAAIFLPIEFGKTGGKLAIAILISMVIMPWMLIRTAQSVNLYADEMNGSWNKTYAAIYNTCRKEGKDIATCRQIAVDTADHYQK